MRPIAAALLGAAAAALLTATGPVQTGLESAGIETDYQEKLLEVRDDPGDVPLFYRAPDVPLGAGAYRRSGPTLVRGNILVDFSEYCGASDHPYGDLAPVEVSYGPDGFRDELPLDAGGIAIVGNSYAEAGFASWPETIPGHLLERHGLPAANFGVALTRGPSVLAHLRLYVLPRGPTEVVWIAAERFDLKPGPRSLDRDPRSEDRFFRPSIVRDLARGWARSVWVSVRDRARDLAGTDAVLVHRTLYLRSDPPIVVDCPAPPTPEQVAAALPALSADLETARDLCRASGARLTFVLIPCRARVLDGFVERSFDLDNGASALAGVADRLGIGFVDPTVALRAAAGNGLLPYNPVVDQHLDGAGMAIVADEIAAALARDR